MQFTTISLLVSALFAASTIASPSDQGYSAANQWRPWGPQCGAVNGNCYENGCGGEMSPDRVTCTTGQWAGCGCGYQCGPENGSCFANGCEGMDGRCTRNYNGCTCNMW